MKKLLIFSTLIAPYVAYGQTSLSAGEMEALINKQFRPLTSNVDNSTPGFSAAVDMSESKRVVFKPSFVLEWGDVIAAKLSTGYSDGFADLFTNSKLNTSTSIGVDYHFMPDVDNGFLNKMSMTSDLTKISAYNALGAGTTHFSQFADAVETCRLSWLTVGGQFSHDEFKLFDSGNDFPDRIYDQKFNAFQLRGSISIYNWNAQSCYKTFFITAGITYDLKSNYLDLDSKDITITKDLGVNPDDTDQQMTSSKKYTAYSGEYIEFIDVLNFNVDYYHFFGKERSFALHLYPVLKWIEAKSPQLNIGTGILFPFQNKEKGKTAVNVEAYFNMVDMFTRNDRIYEKNKIGLRFTFPINFNPREPS